ncbi:MAG: RNase adapter RapZ [Candidatus Aminicenantes bacterium]
MKSERFLIITGLSGSGKTVVSRFLEDLGYYCIDNLPAKLISNFIELWRRKEVEIEKVALVIDIREAGFETEFLEVLSQIKKGATPRLIFLEASDETLLKRYSESRRPHPLKSKKSILESIQLERDRLTDVKRLADEVVDTSETDITQLKEQLTRRFLKKKIEKLQIQVVSFGYKYGVPLESDLLFDTRFLINPFYVDELRDKTGKDIQVKEYVLGEKETKKYLQELKRFMDYLLPRFVSEGKSHLTISVGCTGGKHRSVLIAEELKNHLKKRDFSARIYHRDLYK